MPKVSFWFRVISENDFTGGHFAVQSNGVWILAGGPLIVVYHKVCVTIDSEIMVILEITIPLSNEAHSDVYHATLSGIIHGNRHVLGL